MSYVSSAGRRGKTCRQDVLGGVDVPVVPGAAGGARPVPRGAGQLSEQVATGAAVPDVPPRQGAVPHDPDTAERAFERARLFDVWVSPALVSRPHDRILSGGNVMSKLTRAGRERRFLPGLKTAVSTPQVR